MLVSQPSTGKVLLLRDGQVSEFIAGLRHPHDVVFASVGGKQWVFIAESHRVMRYAYDDRRHSSAPAGEVAVDGLPDQSTPELRGNYGHYLKNIAIHGSTLYVSIASTCNACVSDTVSDPQRATIYTYDAAGHQRRAQAVRPRVAQRRGSRLRAGDGRAVGRREQPRQHAGARRPRRRRRRQRRQGQAGHRVRRRLPGGAVHPGGPGRLLRLAVLQPEQRQRRPEDALPPRLRAQPRRHRRRLREGDADRRRSRRRTRRRSA